MFTFSRVLVLLAAAVCLASCGDEASSTAPATSTAAPASTAAHAAFLKELNATCKTANAQITAINRRRAEGGVSPVAALEQGAAIYAQFLPRLEALDAPAADQAVFARFLRTARRSRGLVDRLIVAARRQDAAEVAALSKASANASAERLEAALDLGAVACGQTS